MSLAEPLDPLRRVVKIERLVSKIYFPFFAAFPCLVKDGEKGRACHARKIEELEIS